MIARCDRIGVLRESVDRNWKPTEGVPRMGPCYMFAASWANCRPGEARRMVRESGVFGRGFGRAPGDFRRSFRMEWLRIEFWTHRRKPFSKPTEELRRLAPARDGGIWWILGGLRGLPQPPISLSQTFLSPPLQNFSAPLRGSFSGPNALRAAEARRTTTRFGGGGAAAPPWPWPKTNTTAGEGG